MLGDGQHTILPGTPITELLQAQPPPVWARPTLALVACRERAPLRPGLGSVPHSLFVLEKNPQLPLPVPQFPLLVLWRFTTICKLLGQVESPG